MKTTVRIKEIILQHQLQLTKAQKRYVPCKRIADVCVAAMALVALSPLLLFVALFIKLESPTEPVIFVQPRVGMGYKTFKLYKFRSMKSTAPRNVATREFENVEQYITKFGAFIRKTSIDELPQLFNIVRGDMSMIGPRPLVWTEREVRFLRRWYGIYQIRPGISGLAQINGRDTVDNYEKVRYDRMYLQHISCKLDIKLFFQSIWVVLGRIGFKEGKTENTEDQCVPCATAVVHGDKK